MGEGKQHQDPGLRKTAVLHRNLGSMPMAHFSYGARINDGVTSYLDLSSGAGVLCLGHSCAPVKDAMRMATSVLPYIHAGQFTAPPIEDLAERLIALSGFDGGSVMFLNGGGEAIEAACKLALQYFIERGQSWPPQYFARQHSYHGNSMFCLRLGDHPRKHDYVGMLPNLPVTRFPAYRRLSEHSLAQCLGALEDGLAQAQATGRPAIVVIEPIGGTTLGIEPSTHRYLSEVRALCDKYEAILIYDEVLCGNFRTGHLFAWQYYQEAFIANIAPDIVVTGKGLTAGYFPLSAVIASDKIMRQLRSGSHRLWHSTTNQNHPIGCAAACAALDYYLTLTPALQSEVATVLCGRRQDLLAARHVVAFQGVGALWGLHLDPLVGGLHLKFKAALFERRISCYTDGSTGNKILIAPPYTIELKTLDNAISTIIEVLTDLEI